MFTVFYNIFTLKSITCIFWPGILLLQRSPISKTKCVFIIFYTMLYNFTLKSIKYTFWPGILPLQGSPTGKQKLVKYMFDILDIVLRLSGALLCFRASGGYLLRRIFYTQVTQKKHLFCRSVILAGATFLAKMCILLILV